MFEHYKFKLIKAHGGMKKILEPAYLKMFAVSGLK